MNLSSVPSASDPPSSNCDTSSADATTDGFEGGLVSEAHTESSSAIGLNSPFSGSVGVLEDHELLEMLQTGELEYSIEKDSGYDAEEGDMESINLHCDSSLLGSDHTSPSKKRMAENEDIKMMDTHLDKKLKLEEIASPSLCHEFDIISSANINDNSSQVFENSDDKVASPQREQKSEILSETPILPSKPIARTRPHSLPPSTPTMVTRTRAMTAMTASGQEIVVPEHSHTLPKWMPRAPIRAIEIPVWTIRETYEEEETLRDAYRAKKIGSASEPLFAYCSLEEIEARLMKLADSSKPANNSVKASETVSTVLLSSGADDSDEEEVCDETYYAVRHYRYEILERLRWESGPGSDRFKQEDRNMSVDQFRAHELWATYFGGAHGKLLPPEKWAQNLVQARPKPNRKEKAPADSNARNLNLHAKHATKGNAPIVIPKGFVLKIKSATGTAVIRTGPSIPSTLAHGTHAGASSATPKSLASSKQTPTPQKPVVKKSGLVPTIAPPVAPPRFTVKKTSPLPPTTPVAAPKPIETPPKARSTLIFKFGSKTFGTASSAPSASSSAPLTANPQPLPITQNKNDQPAPPQSRASLPSDGSSAPFP